LSGILVRVVCIAVDMTAGQLDTSRAAALERHVNELRSGCFFNQAREGLIGILRLAPADLEGLRLRLGGLDEALCVLVG
jgi:hypothetical protein